MGGERPKWSFVAPKRSINKHTPNKLATLLVDKNLERSERFLSTITLYKLLLFFNVNFNIYISSHSSKRML